VLVADSGGGAFAFPEAAVAGQRAVQAVPVVVQLVVMLPQAPGTHKKTDGQ
jgi:hypothetical protein